MDPETPKAARSPRRVVVETPFRPRAEPGTPKWHAETVRNREYLDLALLDSINRGEAPFASHVIYTRVLAEDPVNRAKGLELGEAWRAVAEATIVYTDIGISEGMKLAVQRARELGQSVICREIQGWKPATLLGYWLDKDMTKVVELI